MGGLSVSRLVPVLTHRRACPPHRAAAPWARWATCGLLERMTGPYDLEAHAAVEQLDQARREVGQLRGEVEDVCRSLREIARCAWSGPAAEAWRAGLVELWSQGESAGAGLDRLSADLDTAASRVRQG